LSAWVYKVNSTRPGKPKDWHFDQYFSCRGRKAFSMGGTGRIRSPQSWARLAKVKKGDLFVCYQTDERKIYGLSRAAGPGFESEAGSGRCNAVDFVPRGLRLQHPVDVRRPEVREIFRHIRAFTVPSRGTIHALARDEWQELIRAMKLANPEQKKEIQSFVKGKV
jgi:hypothetical protein